MTAELRTPRDRDAREKPLIEAREISLHVPLVKPGERNLLASPGRLIRDLYLSRSTRVNATLIDGISFSLARGERLGLIGSNGAGKSTLLRVLAGIYQPSSGTLAVQGSAKGLFDISLGMRAEATGLENIYLRGLQMGLGLKRIRTLIPAVMAFSELGEDIEKQLNTYSSGMRLRLAIAISTMVEPDILLLDEWIGAGDAAFNEKVRKRMMELVETSRGLVLATHNTALMKSLCTHGMVLDKGRTTFLGPVDEALKFYAERTAEGEPGLRKP
ncbi:ABC-2 type transport system ATP-binding protein/lipopolysaccharide transport system ATP-binding protein [Hoeflea marina]|uniref:ABC-2 type transport system ATP-binding protein/lipopolysaccharide transport system ATP-binding protein n=1 Tax=Hoeflea marina TaxID=274592 RepID=A0A317PIR6_9HYPH|nr:ABC transporter ATP-binding protein [Hoeflea marina]PWW00224.1 ABC-2 type transport system ATP-binding protein/lipopolysaccharide transport system ATP-binding protein [Hoeflea marina]